MVFTSVIEQGPIRPPSEAQSLLLRITRNCPWNRCEFCHCYKRHKFSLRTVDEIKKDIDTIQSIAAEMEALSWKRGFGGKITASLAKTISGDLHQYPEGYRSVLLWLCTGAKNVFLQDADNLVIKTKDLVEILKYLKEVFPSVERITTYSRARTVSKKSLEELQDLCAAGLSRIHTGLESGYEPLLDFVQKGVTAKELIDAGRKVKQAGISLSEYIMPGLGGKSMWREHAIETARVLNAINPDFIRVRTLKALPMMAIYKKIETGEMELLSDEEIVAEERLLVENLDGITSRIVSDHILNLLEEVEGKFPEAKAQILAVIDRYFALPEAERANFRLGRRTGYYRSLDDLENPSLRPEVDQIMRRIELQNPQNLDQVISKLMESFI